MKLSGHKAISLLLPLFAVFLLIHPGQTVQAVSAGLTLCLRSVIPSLFPFFVFSEYWVRTGSITPIAAAASSMMQRLFRVPGCAATAFLLGAIGGYPLGARVIGQLHRNGQLRQEDAEQALTFCNNGGPAFIIGVAGSSLLHSTGAGVLLYVIHILSALLTGFLLRPKQYTRTSDGQPPSTCNESFALQLTGSISEGGATMMKVCIFILFFSILTQSITTLFPIVRHNNLFSICLGLLELANGLKLIGEAGFSFQQQFIFSSMLLGFGGLCIHMQSQSLLQAAGITGRKMYAAKALQAAISTLLAIMTVPLLPAPMTCISTIEQSHAIPVQSLLLVIIAAVWLLLVKKTYGKPSNNRI